MATLFGDALHSLSGALEDTFGEAFELHPHTKGKDVNKDWQVDSDRPVVAFTGTWTADFARAFSNQIHDAGIAARGLGQRASARPVIGCRISVFSTRPKIGDIIVRLSDGSRWRLAEPRSVGLDWFELDLNKA